MDEANVEFFNRHLLFLKPDIIVVLDDIKLKGNATIENLLQLNEITQIENTEKNFRMNKNNVEFWIHPVLPEDLTTTLKKRTVQGNDVHGLPDHREGILQTIHIESKAKEIQFLTVISILEPDHKKPPAIQLKNDTLSVFVNEHKKILKLQMNSLLPNQPIMQPINQ